MFLYDLPLVQSSMKIKTIGGIFTQKVVHTQAPDSKNDNIIEKLSHQIISAKTNCFQLYKIMRMQQQKLSFLFVSSTPVFGVIVNIQPISVRFVNQSTKFKESLDLVIVTLMSGEMILYNYQPQKNQFVQLYRQIIFDKVKNLQNIVSHHPKNIGNYISTSQSNHFMIASIKQFKKLYSIDVKLVDQKLKFKTRAQAPHIEKNVICWGLTYLPALNSDNQTLGRYIAIEKKMAIVEPQQAMINEEDYGKKINTYIVKKSLVLELSLQAVKVSESSHLIIPISPLTYIVFSQNRFVIKQLFDMKKSKQQKKEQQFEMRFPIRQNLSACNIKVMFTCFTKRHYAPGNENLIYLMNQMGDLFKIQYSFQTNLISNFNIKYINSLSTANSIVFIERLEEGKYIAADGEVIQTKHEDGDLVVLGYQRFSTSMYLLKGLTNQSKPKQTKVCLRGYGKAKATKSYPQITSENSTFRVISERSKQCENICEIEQFGVIMDLKIADLRSNLSNNDKQKQSNFQIYALTNGGNLRHEEQIQQTQVDAHSSQLSKSYLKIIKNGLKIKQINSINFNKPSSIFCLKKLQKDTYHRLICICQPNKTTILLQTGSNLNITRDYSFDESFSTQYVGKLEDDSTVQISLSKIRHIKKQKVVKDIVLKNRLQKATSCGSFVAVSLVGGQIFLYQMVADSLVVFKQIQIPDQATNLQFSPMEKIQGENAKRSHFFILGTKNYEFHISPILKQGKTQSSIKTVFNEIFKVGIESFVCIHSYFSEDETKYFLFVGLQDGRMIKYNFDKNMKKLKQKQYKVGNRPVKCIKIFGDSQKKVSILCVSSKTYLYYFYRNKQYFSLMDYPHIQCAAQLRQPDYQNTIMVYSEGSLRNISIETFGQKFHEDKVDLFYSGKKMIVFLKNIGIIEGDSSLKQKKQSKQDLNALQAENMIKEQVFEPVWQSQFTIYRPKDNKKVAAIYFDKNNQVCLSVCYSKVEGGQMKGYYLVFGCAKGLNYHPKIQAKQHSIKVYAWFDLQAKFQFLYKLDVEGVPLVIQPFFRSDKIIVGIANSFKLYEFGKKKLLKKAQQNNLSSNVNQIKVVGEKIYVTQVSQSFKLYKYVSEELAFYAVSDDILPRYTTAMNVLDSQTLCGADKFGNIFISRLSQNAKNQFDNFSLNSFKNNQSYLQSCQYKFNLLAKTNVGQIITSLNKSILYTCNSQALVYSTVNGKIGIMCPLAQKQEIELFIKLQWQILKKLKALQSYKLQKTRYGSIKNIVDGEIIQLFDYLTNQQQQSIANQLNRTVGEIVAGIQHIKNKFI